MAKVSFDVNRCKACGLCVEACPKKIIRLSAAEMNSKGYHPAEIAEEDKEKCIACAFCATMCPDVVIKIEK